MMVKIEIEISEEKYEKLTTISNFKHISVKKLIQSDIDNLIQHYKDQFASIGLIF